jgi:hypothetical protein
MEVSNMAKIEEGITQSVQSSRRHMLAEITWEEINDPGTYVVRGSGDLYRFPKESLIPGTSPSIVKESRWASVLVKLSEDPFITTFKARLLAAQHNIEPNF